MIADKHSMNLARKAAEVLSCAFVWSETKEGQQFWNKVHQRLKQIAKDGDLQ